MTNAEKQEIIEAVLAALATNSKTIAQLSPKQSLIDSDLFEVAGGSRITFANLVASVLASNGYAAATAAEQQRIWSALMANFAATEANETSSGSNPSKINAMQSRIVLLDSMGSTLDGEGYVVKPGDWYYQKSGGYQIHLKKQSGATSFKASVGVLYVNKRTGKTYLWSSDEEDMIELSSPIHVVNNLVTGGEGDALSAEMGKELKRMIDDIGTGSISAFTNYAVVESVSALPDTGVATTGYIVGTRIYAYVGSHGDTADGKYQDLGGVVSVIPTIDPVTKNWIIGGVLTDRPSRGEKGDNAPIPYVGDGGYWYVAGVSTGVKAQGDAGDINISEGETPTLTIVRNLHTEDDEQNNIKVLSAGMGKELGDAVFDNAILNVDYSDVQKSNVYINGTKWAVDSQSRYQGKFVDVTNYKGWAFKIGGVWIPSGSSGYWWLRFAMVTSKSFSNGGDIPFVNVAPYNAKVENSTSEWHEGVIPSIEGNIYLYIYCYNSTGTPVDFPPELYVTDPNPSSRIERLEGLTDGVDEIKEGWFAISGEPYQLKIKENEVGLGQTIAGAANNMGQYMPSPVTMCLPKVPFDPPSSNYQVYHPSASECFCVDDLPNKVLHLKFNLTPGSSGRWAMYIALYDSSLNCYSRIDEGEGVITVSESDNWEKDVFDFKNEPQCKYFKLLLFYQTNSQTSDNAGDVPLVDDFMEITQQVPAQESMPDRVEALESRVNEIGGGGVRKFTMCSYNIGHFSLGKSADTFISDQKADYSYENYFANHVTPFSNYAAQRARWRQMLNEYNPDIIGMCEYITTFAHNQAGDVQTDEAIFGKYPYNRVGKLPSAGSYMRCAVFSTMKLGTSTDVDFETGRYYQCVDVNMGGTPVKLVVAHLDPGNATKRAAQMQTLVNAFSNETHVIICGDFNNPSTSEWDAFFTEGYTMANHDYIGDILTYPATGTEIWSSSSIPSTEPDKNDDDYGKPLYAIDNIIVKGFAISNVRVIDRCDLTDHMGVICDLTLID